MKKIVAFVAGIVLMLLFSGLAFASYIITDDATGGDCVLIGTWDATSKTCTLTTDIYVSGDGPDNDAIIVNNGSDITLDGDGHTLTGPGSSHPNYVYSHGVWVIQRPNVTVRNLNINDFYWGIFLHFSNDNRVICNNVTNNRTGIDSYNSNYAQIARNHVSGSDLRGIFVDFSLENDIVGNSADLNILSGGGHTVRGNTFLDSAVSISSSTNNMVYNNNFINSPIFLDSATVLNHESPIGGNYWTSYDTPEEGCNDLDSNGFCDLPYYVDTYGTDYIPLSTSFDELLAYSIKGAKGNNNWYVSDVQIDLTAINCSNVQEIHFVLDGFENIFSDEDASILVDSDGTHEFTYWAVDNMGNPGESKTVYFKIDKTPPSVFVDADPKTLWPPNHKMVDVLVSGYAEDPASGIAISSITVTDEYGIYNMSIEGFGSIIQLESWSDNNDPDGRRYTIEAVATDMAGNSSSSSVDVVVIK